MYVNKTHDIQIAPNYSRFVGQEEIPKIIKQSR